MAEVKIGRMTLTLKAKWRKRQGRFVPKVHLSRAYYWPNEDTWWVRNSPTLCGAPALSILGTEETANCKSCLKLLRNNPKQGREKAAS